MPVQNDRLNILLNDKDAMRLLDIFAKAGHEARFIGGCVRDALLGRDIKDIDLATTSLPDETTAILEKNNIKAIPTGIEHGTVSALLNDRRFEITTLRADIDTDGRHAKVAFTKDWEVDAQRRDFTINALSVDAKGTLHDTTGGGHDLNKKELRFIGNAAERIREDYLRILRYFRFASQLGWALRHTKDLDTCDENAVHLGTLSRERIQAELFKLLLGDAAAETASLMQKHGIWNGLIEPPIHIVALKKLIALEDKHKDFDALRRLLALIGLENSDKIDRITALSNKEKKHVHDIKGVYHYHCDNRTLTRQLYDYGACTVKDFYYLQHNEMMFAAIDKWQKPVFPVTAADVMPFTNGEGPLVGIVLNALENYWLDNGFTATKDQLIAMVEDVVTDELN